LPHADGDIPLRAGPCRAHHSLTPPVSHSHARSMPVHVATGHSLPSPPKIIAAAAAATAILFSSPLALAGCSAWSSRLRPGGEPARRSPPPFSPTVRSLFGGSAVRCVSTFVLRRRCGISSVFSFSSYFFLKAMEWLYPLERWFLV
jgi:hypothetical protein